MDVKFKAIQEGLLKKDIEMIYIDNKIYLINRITKEIIKTGNKSSMIDYIQKSLVDEGIDFFDNKEVSYFIQCNAVHLSNFTYFPYKEKIMDDNGKKEYNLFKTQILYDKTLSKPYAFPTLDAFFDIFFNNEKEKAWFMQRIAYTIQHPEDRLPTSAILTGVQGSGKDVMRRILAKTLHPSNVSNIDGKSLEGSFNSYIAKKLVIFANEVMDWENRKQIENFLKNYVTNDNILCNEKFMPQFHVRNFAFWVFATNDHNFIPFDEMDRRYTIFYNTKVLKDNMPKEQFDRLIRMINEEAHITDEFHALYHYLKEMNIPDVAFIREPLKTSRKSEMIDAKFGSSNFWNILVESFKKIKLHDKEGLYYFKPADLFDKYSGISRGYTLKEEEGKKLNIKHFKYKITGMNIVEDRMEKPIRIGDEVGRWFVIRSEYLLREVLEDKFNEYLKSKQDRENDKELEVAKMREMDDSQ